MVSWVVSEGRLLEEGMPAPGVVGRGVAVWDELNDVSQDCPEVTSSNHDENRPSNRLLDNCRDVSCVVVSVEEPTSETVGSDEEGSTGRLGAEGDSGTATTGEDATGGSEATEGSEATGGTGATEEATEGMTMTVVSIEV